MNIPDLLFMDYEDESPVTPTPNEFVLSFYKENTSMNASQGGSAVSFKRLRRKRRQSIVDQIEEEDLQEFENYVAERPIHASYADRMFVLRKLNNQKKDLQVELERKLKFFNETRRMSEEIHRRKLHLESVRTSLEIIQQQIEQKENHNMKIQAHIDKLRPKIRDMKEKTRQMKKSVQLSRTAFRQKLDTLTDGERSLQLIRRKRVNELVAFVFPIRRISADDDILRARRQALKHAQISFFDESIINEQMNDEDIPTTPEDNYQIVNSYLPLRGDYRIENLIVMYDGAVSRDNADGPISDFESLHSSPSSDAYEILAALSYSCQLINIVACFLCVKLPFHLHQWEFNRDKLIKDDLRADIAKLNANIVSICLSQGIAIELTDVSYTLENLLKLLSMEPYPPRPKPVVYPQSYIDILEGEVVDISRALGTSYWFDDDNDDDENNQRSAAWEEDEYEIVSASDFASDDVMAYGKQSTTSTTTSNHQQSSVMNNSNAFWKSKGADLINSVLSKGK